jgi:hypothetical protein
MADLGGGTGRDAPGGRRRTQQHGSGVHAASAVGRHIRVHQCASAISVPQRCEYAERCTALQVLRSPTDLPARAADLRGKARQHGRARLRRACAGNISLHTIKWHHAHEACACARSVPITAVGGGLLLTKSIDSYRPRLGVHMCTLCVAHACACAHMQRARASVRVCVRAARQRQS